MGAGILLLINADLASRLQVRTVELEALSRRMVRQHEEERRHHSRSSCMTKRHRCSAAVKMQLGVVRERVAIEEARRLDRALELVDEGMRGIRNVTNDLRPSLLDDLGLLPALRSLVADFAERRGVKVTLDAPGSLPVLSDEAEVAIFRALQESLSNVARHAGDAPAQVEIQTSDGEIRLRVADQGPGFGGEPALARLEAEGHLGLAGMRERITALGGDLVVDSSPGAGVVILIRIPVSEGSVA